MGPRKGSKKAAPKSKRSSEEAADTNPKKKAKSEPEPPREPEVHQLKWKTLGAEFAEADNPAEMTLEGFADLLEKAEIDATSAPTLVLCWKLDFKLRNASQVVQHDDYTDYFRFDRETVGGLKRQLETSRFDAASLDIDEFRCACARVSHTHHAREIKSLSPRPPRLASASRRAASSTALRSSSSASRRRRASSATCSSRSSRSCSRTTRPAKRASAARSRTSLSPSSRTCEKSRRLALRAHAFSRHNPRARAASRSSKTARTSRSPSTSGRSSSSSP